jgi:hypothetical protein
MPLCDNTYTDPKIGHHGSASAVSVRHGAHGPQRKEKTRMWRQFRLHLLICGTLLVTALPLTGNVTRAATNGREGSRNLQSHVVVSAEGHQVLTRPTRPATLASLVLPAARSNAHAKVCILGEMRLPYLNRGYVADQGCSGDRLVGDYTLTLGDTSGTNPVPTQLILDMAHCDAKSRPGACLYYMTGDINIPATTSLTIESGVTLVDQNTGWCHGYTTPNDGCDSNGSISVGGSLVVQPGATMAFSRVGGDTPGFVQVISGGSVILNGTPTAPIVLTSAVAKPRWGDWGGLSVAAGGQAALNYVRLSYAGGGAACALLCNLTAALYVAANTGAVTMTHSTVEQSGAAGVEIGGAAVLTGDTFTRNAGRAVQYDVVPADLSVLKNLTAYGNGDNSIGVYVRGGYGAAYTGSGVWPYAGMTYDLYSDSVGTFAIDGNLTLGAGTTVRICHSCQVAEAAGVDGTKLKLTIAGTAAHPVTLTSEAAKPAAGDWGALCLGAGGSAASVTYLRLRFAGSGARPCAGSGASALAVAGNTGPVNVAHSTVDHSGGAGIELAAGAVLTNDTITHNTGRAVQYDIVPADLSALKNLSAGGNGADEIGIYVRGGYGAAYTGSGVWPYVGLPYHLFSDGVGTFAINGNLTLGAGVTVRVCKSCQVAEAAGVDGTKLTLTIAGTDLHPVTLTSEAAKPAVGDWGALCLGAGGSTANVTYLRLRFAGSGSRACAGSAPSALYIAGGSGKIAVTNSAFDHSAGNDIELNGGQPALRRDTFGVVPKASYGVLNDGASLVNASNNWWGSKSGPSGAGAGTGVAVGKNITFKPWLVAPSM